MNTPGFNQLSQQDQDRIDAYLDGSITPAEFDTLQERMVSDPALRAVMRRYLALDDSLRNEVGADGTAAASFSLPSDVVKNASPAPANVLRFPRFSQPLAWAAAIALLFALGFAWKPFVRTPQTPLAAVEPAKAPEPVASGFAVIGRLFDAEWPEADAQSQAGDTLGAEVFRLARGTAEIQFFSGATMTVEGPAAITLKSAWEATCEDGAVRLRVPPAARGFKLHAPSTEIVDLGTEFGLSVRDGKGQVEVFDGEIALRSDGSDELRLKKGGALSLNAGGAHSPMKPGQVTFPAADRHGARAAEQRMLDFNRWQIHRDSLAKDARLLLYYTFDRTNVGEPIANLALPRDRNRDGAIILAEPVDGRWPGIKQALEFRRPGSRVRVNVPGEFGAFTFSCWARIDSLDRWYNALFMADRYETGEPHWQIRDDGKMMLSVMVDDARPDPKNPGGPPVRFQHLYFSPPMWNAAMSGQWLHLASVFDPAGGHVSHYVNGRRISREEIQPQYHIDTLRIGNAEVGNWGLPFREEPTFAIRNLNGRMDELAIFKTALTDEEIAKLFESSRARSE